MTEADDTTGETRRDGALWVFGYASLIWDPGFPFAERQIAVLPDYHRSFCMWSIHHRGTEAEPGLVLALDAKPGSACAGVAFRVAGADVEATLAGLRARELISSAYFEAEVEVALEDGRMVGAIAYVVDPQHVQYCGGLALEEQARVIARATGGRGPNRDYLVNTAEHLHALGLPDFELDWLVARVLEIGRE